MFVTLSSAILSELLTLCIQSTTFSFSIVKKLDEEHGVKWNGIIIASIGANLRIIVLYVSFEQWYIYHILFWKSIPSRVFDWDVVITLKPAAFLFEHFRNNVKIYATRFKPVFNQPNSSEVKQELFII